MRARLRARLGAYLYVANTMVDRPVTSDELGAITGINPSQVRRDLSGLPRLLGRRGAGYRSDSLARALREELAGDVTGAGAILIAAYAASPARPEKFLADADLVRGIEAARALERKALA